VSGAGLEAAVRDMLGPDRVRPGSSAATPGGSTLAREAPVVVAPRSTEEVAALLQRASGEGWRVSLGGARDPGIAPGEVDLVVHSSAMTGIVEYEPADLTLTAMAGIRGRDLLSRTSASGQWLPLDPPGWGDATLGGLLATGESGSVAQIYGRPRDLTLGLTLVAGDGRVLDVGGRVVKNVAGFDLVRLAVGSRGALGLITRASVRLFPRPERDVGLLVSAPSIDELLPAARSVITSPLPLAGAELRSSWGEADPEPGLLVRIMGDGDPVEAMLAELRVGALSSARVLEGPALAPALSALSGDGIGVTVGSLWVSATGLPGRLEETLEILSDLGSRVSPSGEGVIQASCFSGTTRGWFRAEIPHEDAADALGEARRALESLGGALAIRRAPPVLLERIPALGDAGAAGALMKGIREVFDPAGILRSSPFFPGM
jgi:glycolate oxidase FAD binding subunit